MEDKLMQLVEKWRASAVYFSDKARSGLTEERLKPRYNHDANRLLQCADELEQAIKEATNCE